MIPTAVLITFGLSLLFLILGWVLSASLGLKLDKNRHSTLRLFLILPPTNPIASAILLFRRPLLGLPGLLCYLLAIAILPLGGSIALALEKERRDGFSQPTTGQALPSQEDQSEPGLAPESSKQWKHPLLAAVLENRNPDPRLFGPASIPPRPSVRDHGATQEEEGSEDQRLQELYAMAAAMQIASGEPEEPFQDWEDVSEPLISFFEESEPSLLALEEALARKLVAFPSEGLDQSTLFGIFPRLKDLSISLKYRSQALVLAGNGKEAFRHIRLAFLAALATDHDLLISRLVQLAQFHIALDSVRFALRFHAGSEQDWRRVMQQLDSLDLLPLWVDALRGETDAFAIAPSTTGFPTPNISSGDPDREQSATPIYLQAWNFLAGDCFRAIDLRLQNRASGHTVATWALQISAERSIAEWILEGERFIKASETNPWDDCMPRLESLGRSAMERTVDPAATSTLDKFVAAQLSVEVAKVAIALELHFLDRGSYPEDLEQLVPGFLPELSANPKTGHAWNYQRMGDSGYSLHDGVGRPWTFRSGIPPLPRQP